VPENPLRENHFVGENSTLVENPITVGIFEHADRVRRVF
jgi:hypothetical protein